VRAAGGNFFDNEEGTIEPVISRSYPLAELPAALEALGSRQSWGKVVVTP
jgi:NADPH:quinone reductase-like Zn-dependent oxidoreductase